MRPTSELVGRATELAAMAARLDDAASGRGGLVLLSGEPGIGKSRLAAAVADRAGRRGMSVVLGHCQETEGAPAYWPWTQVLRALHADGPTDAVLAPLLDGAAGGALHGDRFRLFAAAADLLLHAAEQQPLLIVVDDLHRADEASLALLRFVVPALARAPLLLLGAYRDTEVPARHPLSGLLGEIAGDGAFELVALAGLTRAEAGELAARITGDAASVDIGEVADRPIDGEDIVLWHTFGMTHVPRPEDWPVMSVETCGFRMRPVGFFDRNPTLDVPSGPR
ncbi:AAA family ATPase [Pseudonocardia nigra]|uniref:AAA family ATPase n=1 Tax=Pseudonocardia nigra TaxID=1921578 RepID=UPI001C5DC245